MSERYLPTGRTRAEFLSEMNGNLHHDAKYLFEHIAALQNTISVLSISYKKALDRAEAAEREVECAHHDIDQYREIDKGHLAEIAALEAKLRAVGDRIKGKNIFEMRSTPLGSVHDAIGGELEALLK